jgi:hypothetical protein
MAVLSSRLGPVGPTGPSGSGSGGVDETFGAGMYFDGSDTVESGILVNKGYMGSDFDLSILGSWIRTAKGNGFYYEASGSSSKGFLQQSLFGSDKPGSGTYISHNTNNSLASVIIESTTDLRVLAFPGRKVTNTAYGKRRYKIVLRQSNGSGDKAVVGYIDTVTQNGNQYTMIIRDGHASSTQSWSGGGTTSGQITSWGIYRGDLDFDTYWNDPSAQKLGLTLSLWYYSVDVPASSYYHMGFWDHTVESATYQNYLLYTNGNNFRFVWRRYDNGTGDNPVDVIEPYRWHHLCVRFGGSAYTGSQYIM